MFGVDRCMKFTCCLILVVGLQMEILAIFPFDAMKDAIHNYVHDSGSIYNTLSVCSDCKQSFSD